MYIVQENQELANRIQSSVVADEMKSMHDELAVLDEARWGAFDYYHSINFQQTNFLARRYGKLCSRCLRNCNDDDDDDSKMQGDDISCMGTDDGDDHSLLELNSIDAAASYPTSVTTNNVRIDHNTFALDFWHACLLCCSIIVINIFGKLYTNVK